MEMKCPLCSVSMRESEEGCLVCPHCLTRARFRGEELEALNIPGYRARLMELERMNLELIGRIEEEGGRGEARDRRLLQTPAGPLGVRFPGLFLRLPGPVGLTWD